MKTRLFGSFFVCALVVSALGVACDDGSSSSDDEGPATGGSDNASGGKDSGAGGVQATGGSNDELGGAGGSLGEGGAMGGGGATSGGASSGGTDTGGTNTGGAGTGGAGTGGSGTGGTVTCGPVIATDQAQYSEYMGTVNVTKPGTGVVASIDLDFAFGSSAFRDPSDEPNVFWAVTDRGPNVDCDSAILSANKDYCASANKVFLRPSFTPTIVKVELGRSAAPECKLTVNVIDELPILNSSWGGVTGLPIAPSYNTESAIAPNQSVVPDNDDGMDTEGLVRLPDGTFWISEEYGPSLVHVGVDGRVVERVMPSGVSGYSPDTTVTQGLPEILLKRKQNRGFESLAVSPDGKYLYVATQSPILQPDKATGEASLNLRLFKLELNADGSFKGVVNEWLYVMDAAVTFVPSGQTAPKAKDLKVSEMVALGADDLLVQERTDDYFKVFRVHLADGTKLDSSVWNDLAKSPSLEAVTDFAANGVTPLVKTAVFDMVSYTGTPSLPKKVESVAVIDGHLLLVNDDDFGIDPNQKTTVTLLPLPAAAK